MGYQVKSCRLGRTGDTVMNTKLWIYVFILAGVLFLIAVLTSCRHTIKPDADWLRDEFETVKVVCMGIDEDIPPQSRPTVTIIPGSHVECGSVGKVKGCYTGHNNNITVPSKVRRGVLRHEYIHAILKWATGDSDRNHTSPYFLKCSGMIIENDTN